MIRTYKQLKAQVVKNLLTAETYVHNAQLLLKSFVDKEYDLKDSQRDILYDYGVLKMKEEIARLFIAMKTLKSFTGNMSYKDASNMEKEDEERKNSN